MTGVRIEDDIVRWAAGGRTVTADEAIAELSSRPLLLLMHGFGSFEGDLIGLAPRLPEGFVCASPRAPLVAPAPIQNGYSWWQLQASPNGVPIPATPEAEKAGSIAAAEAVLTWLDDLDARVRAASGDANTGIGQIVLMGFSQGGSMVTTLMRLRPERFVCGVNCSGFVSLGEFEGDATLSELQPPMFWGRDAADPIIAHERVEKLTSWASTHTSLEAHLYDGILHGIGVEELEDISAFLTRQVAQLTSGASQ